MRANDLDATMNGLVTKPANKRRQVVVVGPWQIRADRSGLRAF
jgi:hypothetical protein